MPRFRETRVRTFCALRGAAVVCEYPQRALCSPFLPYVVVAVGLNAPAIFFAGKSSYYIGCVGARWLDLNFFFSIAHVLASFYVAGQTQSFKETIQTLCHDRWFAGYILMCFVSFAWLCVGAHWGDNNFMNNGDCPQGIDGMTENAYYLGFTFFGLGTAMLIVTTVFSCICMRSDPITDEKQGAGGPYTPPRGAMV